MRQRITRAGWTLLATLLIVAACGDSDGTGPVMPASLTSVEGPSATMVVGETATLTVRVNDSNGDPMADVPVAWTVGEDAGAVSPSSGTTDAQGRVSTRWTLGTTAGNQTARATVDGVSPATFQVNAQPGPLEALAIDPSELVIPALREEVQLSASGVDAYGNAIAGLEIEWSSLDESIVEVSESGLLTSYANGETQVVAVSGTLADTIDVTVKTPAPLADIVITSEQDTIMVEGEVQLTAAGIDEDGDAYTLGIVTWSSSDETTATVDEEGYVTSHAGGTTTITASSEGVTGEFELVVRGRVHSQDVSSNEVWTKRDSPHWVAKRELWVYGSESPTLTIEPGAEVRFYKDATLKIGWSTNGPGALIAEGTATEPILFTSDEASPAAGDWGGVDLARATTNDTRFGHVTFEYCGGDAGPGACLNVQDGVQIGVGNVTVRESAGIGVRMVGSASFITGSWGLSVQNTADHAIQIGANQAGTLPEGGTFSGPMSSVWVRGGTVDRTQTWPNLGIPYVHSGDRTYVYGSTDPELTIPAGTELRFQAGGGIDIGWSGSNAGTLKVLGTETDPVTMTSSSASPNPGAWRGIYVSQYATNENVIEHAKLSYCGDSSHDSCLRVRSATVVVNDVEIEHSGTYGVYMTHDGRFAPNSADLTISGSGSYPVRLPANSVGTLPLGGDYAGNGAEGIFVDHGTVSRTQSWAEPGVPYVISGGIVQVYSGTGTTLTLEPGLEIRMSSGARIQVGWSSSNVGTLIAEGTAAAPIVFTANSDSPLAGYWNTIEFTQYATADSRFSHAVIEYGTNNLYIRTVPQGLEGLTIRDAEECGVRFHGSIASPPDLKDPARNNTFTDNAVDVCT